MKFSFSVKFTMRKSFGLSQTKALQAVVIKNLKIFKLRFCSFLNILRFSKQKPLRNPLEFSGLFYCSVIKELSVVHVVHISDSLFILPYLVLFVKNFLNFFQTLFPSSSFFIPSLWCCFRVLTETRLLIGFRFSKSSVEIQVLFLPDLFSSREDVLYINMFPEVCQQLFEEFFLFSKNCLQFIASVLYPCDALCFKACLYYHIVLDL